MVCNRIVLSLLSREHTLIGCSPPMETQATRQLSWASVPAEERIPSTQIQSSRAATEHLPELLKFEKCQSASSFSSIPRAPESPLIFEFAAASIDSPADSGSIPGSCSVRSQAVQVYEKPFGPTGNQQNSGHSRSQSAPRRLFTTRKAPTFLLRDLGVFVIDPETRDKEPLINRLYPYLTSPSEPRDSSCKLQRLFQRRVAAYESTVTLWESASSGLFRERKKSVMVRYTKTLDSNSYISRVKRIHLAALDRI